MEGWIDGTLELIQKGDVVPIPGGVDSDTQNRLSHDVK